MVWQIEFTPDAEKIFGKLDRNTQSQIRRYLREKVAPLEDPRLRGEGLRANLSGLWRYRVGDYRVICRILNDRVVILVVKVGHRRDVYD